MHLTRFNISRFDILRIFVASAPRFGHPSQPIFGYRFLRIVLNHMKDLTKFPLLSSICFFHSFPA